MADEKVKVFISASCGSCQLVKQMIEEGRFNLPSVDIIDVSSQEGFPYIAKMGLNKVPVAFKGDKLCRIFTDEETLIIDCDSEFSPEKEQSTSPITPEQP